MIQQKLKHDITHISYLSPQWFDILLFVPNFEDAIKDVDTKEKNIPKIIRVINKNKITLSKFFHQS